jgi:apolipoprotein N-acyltransferase
LIVWPETVYPTTFGRPKSDAGRHFDDRIKAVVERAGVPLVFGAYDVGGEDEYNAAFLVEPLSDSGDPRRVYRKHHLFPLTEYVPWWLESAWARSAMPWLGSWKAGRGSRVLDLNLRDGRTIRAAPLICLDAVVADHAIAAVADGAELFLTLSNDSWFAETPGAHLHLVVSAFRSIETRRPQLRVTNSGISAVIDAEGELVATTEVGQRIALVGSIVPAGRPMTLMLRWGDWFGKTALIGALILLIVAAFRRRVPPD